MKRSEWKWIGISLTFSLVVLAAVLIFTVDEKTLEYLSRLDPRFLVAALTLHFAAIAAWALRIRMMSRSLGYQISFGYCLNLVFANLLVAAVTPSQAGGEPLRIHELYRADVKFGDATAIVLMERVIDGIVLGGGGAVAMLLLGSYWHGIATGMSTIMYTSWILMTAALIIFIQSVRRPEFTKRILKRISRWVDRYWRLRRLEHILNTIDREVDNFHESMSTFVSHGKSGMIWGTLLTMIFWTAEFLIASLILMGLGQPPFFVESFIVQFIIAIIMLVPLTPGGSGVAEVSAISLYGLFVPSSIVGVFVLIWRVILYYVNIAVGIFASMYIVKREIILRKLGLR